MDKKEFKEWFAKANNFRLVYEENRFKIPFSDNFFGEIVEEWYPDVFPYLSRVNDCLEKRSFSYIECLFFVLEYFEYMHTTGCFRSSVICDESTQLAGMSVYLSITDALRYLDFGVKRLKDGVVPVILKKEINRIRDLYEKESPFSQIRLVA